VAGWVAAKAVNPSGVVVVHVTAPDVEVFVAGRRLGGVREVGRPIECELPPGEHRLVTTRRGEVIQDEAFRLGPGGDLVLTAWWDRLRNPRP